MLLRLCLDWAGPRVHRRCTRRLEFEQAAQVRLHVFAPHLVVNEAVKKVRILGERLVQAIRAVLVRTADAYSAQVEVERERERTGPRVPS